LGPIRLSMSLAQIFPSSKHCPLLYLIFQWHGVVVKRYRPPSAAEISRVVGSNPARNINRMIWKKLVRSKFFAPVTSRALSTLFSKITLDYKICADLSWAIHFRSRWPPSTFSSW
jgi:hypothetical protein